MAVAARPIVLYFHGGPGLNSIADKKILTPLLEKEKLDVRFWNEPSQFRPQGYPFQFEGAYSNWMRSAENFITEHLKDSEKVILVAHSFAATPIMYLAQKYHSWIEKLILISPITEVYKSQSNVVSFAIEDFGRLNDFQKAKSLKSMQKKSLRNFDWAMQEALQMAYKDPYLMSHYWTKYDVMDQWLVAQGEAGASMDLMSWKAVQEDFANLHIQPRLKEPLPLHAILILGNEDQVLDQEREIENAHFSFKHVSVVNVFNSAHFPHLEDPEPFISCLKGSLEMGGESRTA